MQKLLFTLSMMLTIAHLCVGQNAISSKQIDKHFNKKESKELAHIISFVDSLVVAKTDIQEMDKAYHHYLDSLHVNSTHGNYNWAFDEEMKYKFLFHIDSTVFNKIWIKQTTSRMVKTSDTTLYYPENFISLDLKSAGDYAKLIRNLGKTNANYKAYYQTIEIAGSLSPSVVAGFLTNHNKFDFDNSNNRLWAAVFLLTLEESVDKKVERYLNN
nr:hypothetical protein [uncultured Draconibacterium sp.]